MLPIVSIKSGKIATHIYIDNQKTNLWWWNEDSEYFKLDPKFYLFEKEKCLNFSKLIAKGIVKSYSWINYDACSGLNFKPKKISNIVKIKSYDGDEERKDLGLKYKNNLHTIAWTHPIKYKDIVFPKVFPEAQYYKCLNENHSSILPNLTVLVYQFAVTFYASN